MNSERASPEASVALRDSSPERACRQDHGLRENTDTLAPARWRLGQEWVWHLREEVLRGGY